MLSVRNSIALTSIAALACVATAAGGTRAPRTSEGAEARWAILDLGTLGSSYRDSSAADVNARGQIVGTSGTASGRQRAFLWQDGKMTDLGTLGGRDSAAAAIDVRGEVVGTSLTAKPARLHAFIWRGGTMTDLGTLGGRSSRPRAIDARGEVVGESLTENGQVHAFLWRRGSMRDLGTLGGASSVALAINARGQVVGSSTTAQGATHAFLWQNGRMRDLGTLGPQYVASAAVAIDARGRVVGTSYTARVTQTGQQGHAFLWRSGRMTDLGTLGGGYSSSDAIALNAGGVVVGSSRTAGGPPRPVRWAHGKIRALPTLGNGPSAVVGVDRRGRIIGATVPRNGSSFHAVVWAGERVVDLGTLGGAESDAAAISSGRIVGTSNTRAGARHAVLWTVGGAG